MSDIKKRTYGNRIVIMSSPRNSPGPETQLRTEDNETLKQSKERFLTSDSGHIVVLKQQSRIAYAENLVFMKKSRDLMTNSFRSWFLLLEIQRFYYFKLLCRMFWRLVVYVQKSLKRKKRRVHAILSYKTPKALYKKRQNKVKNVKRRNYILNSKQPQLFDPLSPLNPLVDSIKSAQEPDIFLLFLGDTQEGLDKSNDELKNDELQRRSNKMTDNNGMGRRSPIGKYKASYSNSRKKRKHQLSIQKRSQYYENESFSSFDVSSLQDSFNSIFPSIAPTAETKTQIHQFPTAEADKMSGGLSVASKDKNGLVLADSEVSSGLRIGGQSRLQTVLSRLNSKSKQNNDSQNHVSVLNHTLISENPSVKIDNNVELDSERLRNSSNNEDAELMEPVYINLQTDSIEDQNHSYVEQNFNVEENLSTREDDKKREEVKKRLKNELLNQFQETNMGLKQSVETPSLGDPKPKPPPPPPPQLNPTESKLNQSKSMFNGVSSSSKIKRMKSIIEGKFEVNRARDVDLETQLLLNQSTQTDDSILKEKPENILEDDEEVASDETIEKVNNNEKKKSNQAINTEFIQIKDSNELNVNKNINIETGFDTSNGLEVEPNFNIQSPQYSVTSHYHDKYFNYFKLVKYGQVFRKFLYLVHKKGFIRSLRTISMDQFFFYHTRKVLEKLKGFSKLWRKKQWERGEKKRKEYRLKITKKLDFEDPLFNLVFNVFLCWQRRVFSCNRQRICWTKSIDFYYFRRVNWAMQNFRFFYVSKRKIKERIKRRREEMKRLHDEKWRNRKSMRVYKSPEEKKLKSTSTVDDKYSESEKPTEISSKSSKTHIEEGVSPLTTATFFSFEENLRSIQPTTRSHRRSASLNLSSTPGIQGSILEELKLEGKTPQHNYLTPQEDQQKKRNHDNKNSTENYRNHDKEEKGNSEVPLSALSDICYFSSSGASSGENSPSDGFLDLLEGEAEIPLPSSDPSSTSDNGEELKENGAEVGVRGEFSVEDDELKEKSADDYFMRRGLYLVFYALKRRVLLGNIEIKVDFFVKDYNILSLKKRFFKKLRKLLIL